MAIDETGRNRPFADITYCTPDDVAEVLDLPDKNDEYGFYHFSDMSHPSYNSVCRMIQAAEGEIDGRLRRTWRVNRVKDHIANLVTYEWDANGYRSAHYLNGGEMIQLHRHILPWDPSQGDKIEMRNIHNTWHEVGPNVYSKDGDRVIGQRFWFDYERGRLFINKRFGDMPYNSVRISYRYGSEESVPEEVRRLCAVMVARRVINMQAFAIKVGLGGDLAGIKDSMMQDWQDEINSLMTGLQRAGSVHSLLR